MDGTSQAQDTPAGCEAVVDTLREAGAAARAVGQRASAAAWPALRAFAEDEAARENDRVWAAICGEPVDPLTALKAIVVYVKPISPGTQWGDVVVRIAEGAIANAGCGSDCPGDSSCGGFQAGYEADRRPS